MSITQLGGKPNTDSSPSVYRIPLNQEAQAVKSLAIEYLGEPVATSSANLSSLVMIISLSQDKNFICTDRLERTLFANALAGVVYPILTSIAQNITVDEKPQPEGEVMKLYKSELGIREVVVAAIPLEKKCPVGCIRGLICKFILDFQGTIAAQYPSGDRLIRMPALTAPERNLKIYIISQEKQTPSKEDTIKVFDMDFEGVMGYSQGVSCLIFRDGEHSSSKVTETPSSREQAMLAAFGSEMLNDPNEKKGTSISKKFNGARVTPKAQIPAKNSKKKAGGGTQRPRSNPSAQRAPKPTVNPEPALSRELLSPPLAQSRDGSLSEGNSPPPPTIGITLEPTSSSESSSPPLAAPQEESSSVVNTPSPPTPVGETISSSRYVWNPYNVEACRKHI